MREGSLLNSFRDAPVGIVPGRVLEVEPMRKSLFIIIFLVFSLLSFEQAQAAMCGAGDMRPYGGYCRGPRWGWYGAGKKVRTVQQVRILVADYFRDEKLTIGEIIEREHFFEVHILDPSGKQLLDVLIVDKRNCRIRSKY